jgi:hypothetical protein
LRAAMAAGKFHGVMNTLIPIGCILQLSCWHRRGLSV